MPTPFRLDHYNSFFLRNNYLDMNPGTIPVLHAEYIIWNMDQSRQKNQCFIYSHIQQYL